MKKSKSDSKQKKLIEFRLKHLFFCLFFILASSFLIINPAGAQQIQQTYPQLDITGYKKWAYKDVQVSPQSNYFAGITQLGGYSPTLTGGPWQERLQLRINGQLSENLSVAYDLEQQPETPDRYNVKVKYYGNELTFGDISASFSGNEFVSTSKYLNGVMLKMKDSWYDVLTVPSAKLKSQTQNLAKQKGINSKGPYRLGHGSIIEGSEIIKLNGVIQKRNIDYTIDYFEGKITFNRILTSLDEFEYSYEYTNVLDLFFPALSKRDFFGIQSRFTIDPERIGQPEPKEEPIINSSRDVFPSPEDAPSDILEEEAIGQYRLKNTPIVMFSERVQFMGVELKKNEDYIIRYDEGKIKLLTRFLPSQNELLIVEYQYYKISQEKVTIAGLGSRGPYILRNNLVPESEKVMVDGKPFVRDLDYTINYEKGEIIFGRLIGITSQIEVTYKFIEKAKYVQPTSKYPKELKLGTTYLRESAKAGAITNVQTAIESFRGLDITKNNYHIYLQNRPLVASEEAGFYLTVQLGNRILTPEVDYAVPRMQLDPLTGFYTPVPPAKLAFINDRTDSSDGYRSGTIKILDQSLILSTSEVIVSYTYYKTIVGRYSGSGDGTRGPYYLRNILNIAPGTETIQVWDQGSSQITTYTRNSSFEPDAGATGYTINYTADNPYILFNEELGITKNFQIIYQYVPPTGFSSRDIAQSVVGVDGSFRIGNLFKFDTAYAHSEFDRALAQIATSEYPIINNTKSYRLNSPREIIENSEKVYVNDRLLNKDIDYFISYTGGGQIIFYYITPSVSDFIRVDYDYQGSDVTEVITKTGDAYRIGAEARVLNDTLTLSGTTKKIDYDFSPLGGTLIGAGSRYKEYNLSYRPDFQSFYTTYSYKENENPIRNYRNLFLRSYDNSFSMGLNPAKLANLTFSYRNYNSLDDILPGATAHTSDSLQESYSFGLDPAEIKQGAAVFNHKYDFRRTFSQTDALRDSNTFSETKIDYYHANGSLRLTERFSSGYDFQLSEPQTIALKHSTIEATIEAISSLKRSIDTSYNFTADLTFKPVEKWGVRASFQNHEDQTLYKNFLSTSEVSTTRNETYHMDLNPTKIIRTSLDHNRQERSTVLVGGTNPKTERTSGDIAISPFSWLSGSWNGNKSESIPETGEQNRTTGNSNSYNVTWIPISQKEIKISTGYRLSDSQQTAPSGTTGESVTNTNSTTYTSTINLLPHPALPLDGSISIENYKNKRNHPVEASQIDTETENQSYSLGTRINPLRELQLSTNYNLKVTKVIKDRFVPRSEKSKTVLDSKARYQLSSWGALEYSRQDEKNQGEVVAGAVADLNIEKTTHSLSLNITMPVDNPVLNNFVFTTSIKEVNYRNLARSSDDFIAKLISFEGTLNF